MKVITVLFGVMFLFNSVSYGADSFTDNLSAPSLTFQGNRQESPTKEFSKDIQEFKKEYGRLWVYFFVGKYLLDGGNYKGLFEHLAKNTKNLPKEIFDENKVIKIEKNDKEIGVVFQDGKSLKRIKVRKTDKNQIKLGWRTADGYEFLIEEVEEGDGMKEIGQKSFHEQMNEFKKNQDPKGYAVSEMSQLVLENKTSEALKLLFTADVFQGKKENLDVPAGILNKLLDAFEKDAGKEETIRKFTRELIKHIVEFSGDDDDSIDVAQAVQKMAGQVWMIPEGVRFTADENFMVQNKKRGKSFIDVRTLPEGVNEVKEETEPGLYGRGTEGISKIRPENIMEFAIHNLRRFKKLKDKIIQYVMLHGGRKVTGTAREHILKGGLSNPHKTLFVNGMLPSSFQPASTGPGHPQIKKMNGKLVGLLDVKQMRHEYIQVNVQYDTEGNMVKVVCQRVKKGEICFSAPGWRDYMIDIGGHGLEGFDDFSVPVTEAQARLFDLDFNEDDLADIEEALKNKNDEDPAPYGALIFKGEPVLVKMNEGFPEALWVHLSENQFADINFFEMHEKILHSEEGVKFISNLGVLCREAKKEDAPMEVMSLSQAKTRVSEEINEAEDNAASLGMTEGICSFIDASAALLGGRKKKAETIKLIRIPVEVLNNNGVEDSKELLKTIQNKKDAKEKFYIELFSSEKPTLKIGADAYEKFDIKKESLPADFKMSRANTITLLPVDKGEKFTVIKLAAQWNGVLYSEEGYTKNLLLETTISPVGHNYDQAGLAKSVFFGMMLSEIAENNEYTKESRFVSDFLTLFRDLYLSGGNDADSFDLTGEDIMNLTRGNFNEVVKSLNKLIKLLPIMPVNVNEQREINEHAKEARIRA